jgi:hypothetical protein
METLQLSTRRKLKKYRMHHPLSISESATFPPSEVGDLICV